MATCSSKSEACSLLSQWSTLVNSTNSTNFQSLANVLEEIVKSQKFNLKKPKAFKILQNKQDDDKVETEFWASCENLYKSFAHFIVTQLHDNLNDEHEKMIRHEAMKSILKVDSELRKLPLSGRPDLDKVLIAAMAVEVDGLLSQCINRKLICECEVEHEVVLNSFAGLVRFATTHCMDVAEASKSFSSSSFALNLYKTYDRKLSDKILPKSDEICRQLQDIQYRKAASVTDIMAAMSLFRELWKFTQFGLKGFEKCDILMDDFERWFPKEFPIYLQTFEKILKSFELDCTKHFEVDKATSSATDSTVFITNGMGFWKQFNVPEARKADAASYFAKEFCGFTLFYIEKYDMRVRNSSGRMPQVLTMAIGNFKFLSVTLQKGMLEIMKEGCQIDKGSVAKVFKQTFEAIDEKSKELIEHLIKVHVGDMKHQLMEAAVDISSVYDFLDSFVAMLVHFKQFLGQSHFKHARASLWTEIVDVLPEIMIKSITNRRTREYFVHLKIIWVTLKDFLELPLHSDVAREKVQNFENFLVRFGMEPSVLIHQQYEALINSTKPTASAVVDCCFIENKLNIKILTAGKLPVNTQEPIDKLFLTVVLFHGDEFSSVPCQKANSSTFGENLEFELTVEQRALNDALVHFKLMRKTLLGRMEPLGEGFIPFRDIPVIDGQLKTATRREVVFVNMAFDEDHPLSVLKHRGKSNETKVMDFLLKMKQERIKLFENRFSSNRWKLSVRVL